jgi:dynein heavy chain
LNNLKGSNFLGGLLDFKKDFITAETIELMEPYLAMEDYDYASALRVCGNVAGLLSWTIAMTKYIYFLILSKRKF